MVVSQVGPQLVKEVYAQNRCILHKFAELTLYITLYMGMCKVMYKVKGIDTSLFKKYGEYKILFGLPSRKTGSAIGT